MDDMGVKHFEKIYKEPKRVNIAKIVNVATYFGPKLVTNED